MYKETDIGKIFFFCDNGLSGELLKDVRNWGYNIFLITEFPYNNGLEYCAKVVEANSKNVSCAVDTARKLVKKGFTFDGVMSLCWDTAKSVSAIASYYGLIGISNASAILATNKEIRSKVFEKEGIPAPRFEICSNLEEVRKFCELINFPIILKPINLSSIKGVILVKMSVILRKAMIM